ncbi:MAG: tRNA delta(2)-isopentenylpyrophosphate transferase [Pseudomonadota bacterium]|jgi:tRNA dimethylallyltransferase
MSQQVSDTLLCLAGPTASGKSAAARAIAERWPIEVINVDSATIYRGMDIGTAKPSRTERLETPHHLLDILDPLESYSAASFRRDALRCVKEIRGRGNIPLLVGGTMLYFKALRDGLNDLPSADPGIRLQLERRAATIGWPAMHAALAQIDPETANRLSPNDSQRIQRALEIWQITGTPMSTLLNADNQQDQPVQTLTLSLEPTERSVLHKAIENRFDQMLDMGLLQEVRALHARGDLHTNLPSIRCVGYRQLWSFIEGEVDYSTARMQAIAATRQLAKRQITWLRSLPERTTIEACTSTTTDRVIQRVGELLGSEVSDLARYR